MSASTVIKTGLGLTALTVLGYAAWKAYKFSQRSEEEQAKYMITVMIRMHHSYMTGKMSGRNFTFTEEELEILKHTKFLIDSNFEGKTLDEIKATADLLEGLYHKHTGK